MNERAGPWTLDRPAFDRLLAFLDPDRQTAADKYEDIRRRLLKLFAWRGCAVPDEYVDRTIDRVARRVHEGADINVADPYQYFHGVALNVLREHWREPERRAEAVGAAASHSAAAAPAGRDDDEPRFACLDACLDRMMPKHRELLLTYHAGDRHIERRQSLASSLSISLTALRIRAHRLRSILETCVTSCVSGSGNETDRANAH